MATRGRLEYEITVPTGGWDTTVGASTATIPAGTYYLSTAGSGSNSLLAEVQAQFGASSVTASLGESGTGICTIAFGSATAITWVDAELRDILGFAGNLSASTSHVGTKAVRGAWVADTPHRAHDTVSSSSPGRLRADVRAVGNAAGGVYTVAGMTRYELDLQWPSVSLARLRIASETTANQSCERFYRDYAAGEASWCDVGGLLRFHPDADAAAYVAYSMVGPSSFQPRPLSDGWVTGPHSVAWSLVASGGDVAVGAGAGVPPGGGADDFEIFATILAGQVYPS